MSQDPGPFQFNARTEIMFLRRNSPCVYFLQEDGGGPVKIGRSNADGLNARLISLQIGNPRKLNLVALVCMSGSRHVGIREESRLHKHFAGFHIQGEWYEPSPSLSTLIAEFSIDTYGGQLREILRSALIGAMAA